VPAGGFWQEILNTDAVEYWGSGMGNQGGVWSADFPWNGHGQSISITMPPLSVVAFKRKP
jgi:1,4-alpha-glucan branching enzyme